MTPDPPVSDEQRLVRDAAINARLTVIAGPGTGKTHTLIARVVSLVEHHELAGGDELVVLSFSRAAVGEIRRRTRSLHGAARRIVSSTFDSYATRLLSRYSTDNFVEWSYDRRINEAKELVCVGSAAPELERIQHILVDEAQDLVGPRAELVLALLRALPTTTGFTIFGDPAQAIYDFEDEGENSAAPFFQSLDNGLVPQSVRLTHNYRARVDRRAVELATIGEDLGATTPPAGVRRRLEDVVAALPTAGSVDTAGPLLRRATGTALLCRTNGIALAVSAELHRVGVPHQLRQPAEDLVIPVWVAETSRRHRAGVLRRSDADEALGAIDPDGSRWDLLRRLGGTSPDEIDVRQVANRIRIGDVPAELIQDSPTGIIVSTVHRAKGLEFSRVLLVPFTLDRDGFSDARVLYVALTRARDDLMRIDCDSRGVFKLRGRWIRSQSGKLGAFETRGSDATAFDHDAFGPQATLTDVEERWAYLVAEVKTGDAVVLQQRREPTTSGHLAYDVLHGGRPIAITTPKFGQDLAINIVGEPPEQIEDLFVEGLATVPAPTSGSSGAVYNRYPLIPTVRIQGFGRPTPAPSVRHNWKRKV